MKAFLLDQRRVAGVGNIYADEALFRAGIHPLKPGRAAAPGRVRAAARAASSRRSRRGSQPSGASIDDYRDSNGERGAMQDEFLIHLREGLPCPRCGATGRRSCVAAGRGHLRLPQLPAAPRGRGARAARVR